MRLLLVTETYPPEINGVAMTSGRMVAGLRARGHWVGLVRPRQHRRDLGDDQEWLVPGIPIPNYSGLRMGTPAFAILDRLIRTQHPDLVHVVTEGPLGWAAVLAARRLGLPVTSGYHTHFDQYSQHYGLRWLTPLVTRGLDALHRRCQATLVPTPELADTLSARGIPNVQVVGRGVDTGLFHPGRRSAALRQSWGIDDDAGDAPLACLYVGRLAPEKNLEIVSQAYAAIAERRPGSRMIWVGTGPAMAGLQGDQPGHVFAGPRMGDDLAAHYASADLFLFGSLSETWGNVVGEAMASGLGVVAYRRAAAEALIRDGENGLAPDAGDAAAFVASALALALDDGLRGRLRQQACQDMARLGWEGVTDRLEQVLAKVAGTG